MAGKTSETLTITAQLRDLVSGGMRTMAAEVRRVSQSQLRPTAAGLKDAFLAVGAAAIGIGGTLVAGAAAIAAWTSSAISGAEAMEKLAGRTGFTTEALSELEFAAQQGGSSIQALEPSLRRFNVALEEMRQGEGEAGETLQRLIGTMTDAEGKQLTQIQLFEKTADALVGIEDTGRRAALAQEIFGRGGSAMLPMLAGGAEGLQKLREQAHLAGVTISTETSVHSAAYVDNLNIMKTALRGVSVQIATRLLPDLAAITGRLARATLNGSLMNQMWAESITAMTRFQQFVAGNEDGLAGLQDELDGAISQLDNLRHSQQVLADAKPGFFQSGKQLLAQRKAIIADIAAQEAKVAKIQAEFDQGITRLQSQRAQAAKLQAEAEEARARAAEVAGQAGGGEGGPNVREQKAMEAAAKSAADARAKAIEQALRQREEAGLDEFELMDLQMQRELEAVGAHEEAKISILETFAIRKAEVQQRVQEQEDAQRLAREEQEQTRADAAVEKAILDSATERERLDLERAIELEGVGQHGAAREAIIGRYRKREEQLDKAEMQRKLSQYSSLFGGLAQLAEAGGARAFAARKAFAIAEAIVNVYAGAARALDLPFPANIAAMASTIAQGMTAVAGIKSASPGGGGAVAGLGGGFSLPAPVSQAAPLPTGQQQGGPPVYTTRDVSALPRDSSMSGRSAGPVVHDNRTFVFQGNLLTDEYVATRVVPVMREMTRMGHDLGTVETRPED